MFCELVPNINCDILLSDFLFMLPLFWRLSDAGDLEVSVLDVFEYATRELLEDLFDIVGGRRRCLDVLHEVVLRKLLRGLGRNLPPVRKIDLVPGEQDKCIRVRELPELPEPELETKDTSGSIG
jgi:hypothetical protein